MQAPRRRGDAHEPGGRRRLLPQGLRCSAAERLAYNTVVGFARANVLLTAMEGAEKSDGWEMSLLNPENHKEAKQQLANIRLACNGGGRQDFLRHALLRSFTHALRSSERGLQHALVHGPPRLMPHVPRPAPPRFVPRG